LITRVRSHPPIWPWLLYRLRDHPLPDRWAGWAYDDITGRGWLLRSQFVDHLLSAAIVLLFGHTVWPKFALTWFLVVWPAVVLLLCALTNRRATRDNALLRHGFGESGPRPSRWAASAEER
jgi:hypothetical protein